MTAGSVRLQTKGREAGRDAMKTSEMGEIELRLFVVCVIHARM